MKISKLKNISPESYRDLVNALKQEYLESWMTLREFSKKYNIQIGVIKEILKCESLNKDLSKWNPSKNPETIKKIQHTKEIKYGTKNWNNSSKAKDTRLQKYDGNYFSDEGYSKINYKNWDTTKQEAAKQKQQETMKDKYGITNIFENVNYIQECFKKKYDVKNPSQLDDIKEKKKETCEEHYGVPFTFQSEEIKQKAKETLQERYGVENANQNKKIKEKSKQTRLQNGTQRFNGTEVDTFLKKWNKKRKPTVTELQQYMGISQLSNTFNVLTEDQKKNFAIKVSYLEIKVEEFLKENNISYEKHNRQLIKPEELDFYLPDYHVAIEVNDIYSHNSSQSAYNKPPKDIRYHHMKTMKCNANSIRLIHMFEPFILNDTKWNILQDIVLHACGKSKRIYARNLVLQIIPAIQMKPFFEKNNIQGYRNARTAFVLIDKTTKEPMMCYTVGDAYFGKGKYDAEIARGACKLGYSIVGGASKLWKHIIQYYSTRTLDDTPGVVNSIVYYVDLNHYDGQSMNFLNNVHFVKNQPGFWNYWTDTKELKNRDPYHHKEIKELEKQGKVLVIGNSGTQVNVWLRN